MNNNSSLSTLTENLVSFTARRVTSSLIWCLPELCNSEEVLSSCSYLTEPDGTGEAKVFMAERYGGSGIQRNGGGARCGYNGRYQVKGIGANPLVGEGSDWHHSNGALSASQAIYEALWGEVLSQVLPYGAVRTQAVLLTDNYIDIKFERSRGPAQRALLIREPVIRPAHFERAPYFLPQSRYASQLIDDAKRVGSVIHQLPSCLPIPSQGFSKEAALEPEHHCLEGLCELARRQARQIAFCRSRFLLLTTSPSNIAMDGRLLDFNGLSCLFPGNTRSGFEYQLKMTQLMKEPSILLQGLTDLCLYLGKYLFNPAFASYAQQQLESCFQFAFYETCSRSYLELFGIPEEFLSVDKIPEVLKPLAECFSVLINRHNSTQYCRNNNECNETSLEHIAAMLINHHQNKQLAGSTYVKGDIHFVRTLQAFSDAAHWLLDAGRLRGLNAPYVLKIMEEQARQRLQPRNCLEKINMLGKISDLIDAYRDDKPLLTEAFSTMKKELQVFTRIVFGNGQRYTTGGG